MIYKELLLKNETLILDGHEFISCELVNCKLIYNGGKSPVLKYNTITNSLFLFGDAAARTFDFAKKLLRMDPAFRKGLLRELGLDADEDE